MIPLLLFIVFMSFPTAMQNESFQVRGYDCSDCHRSSDWRDLKLGDFDHSKTAFPLVGAHTVQNCTACHQGTTLAEKHQFSQTPGSCADCHLDVHETTLGNDCAACHQPESWTVILESFNHEKTVFPLQGSHRFAPCQACHTEKPMIRFDYTPTECYACHRADYERAENPDHVASGFSLDCQGCHEDKTPAWVSNFDHNLTAFPLIGLHKPVLCADCHVDNQYDLPTDCQDCHLEVYDTTDEPDHKYYGYPAEECAACHSEFGWEPHIYQHDLVLSCVSCHLPDYVNATKPVHDSTIGYSQDCERCHTATDTWEGAAFDHQGIVTDCISCHLQDYTNATDPVHDPNLGFTQTCESCHHTFDSWQGASFDHEGIVSGCVNCHLSDYTNATDPVHDPNFGFTQTCESCHTRTDTWQGASFDHQGIVSDCVNCHLGNYNATTDPDHQAISLDTNCETCHVSTTDWTDVNFSHQFPISPSPHQNDRSETCTSCHLNPYGPPTFSCTLSPCHQGVANEHSEGGTWKSCTINGVTVTFNPNAADDPQCVQCHPNGNENDCGGGEGGEDRIQQFDWREHLKIGPRWSQP
jgi:hypothetical protein